MKLCIVNFSTKAINSVSSGSDEIQLLIRYIRCLSVFDLTLVSSQLHSPMDSF